MKRRGGVLRKCIHTKLNNIPLMVSRLVGRRTIEEEEKKRRRDITRIPRSGQRQATGSSSLRLRLLPHLFPLISKYFARNTV